MGQFRHFGITFEYADLQTLDRGIGRNPEHAAVAFTTGILEQLSPEELAGVAAHELAHIKHRDTLTMTITAVIAGAISMLANMAMFMGHGDRRGQPGGIALTLVTRSVSLKPSNAPSR